ncbi:VIT family protein [Brevibacterium sp. 5221]|uniref:VIT family protein n=1 Tax=Brevibacterium rongguiense TaxID=2695267 RepID=A0A6N9H5A6_9MICO|nr:MULTISPECIES: VIT family protein [Brevibacterium]MYM19021.1 VIT family protein [Brevibacterium rongguiense]WAL40690.1 VIT family protein [Brevibacterium sp. BRM-1]
MSSTRRNASLHAAHDPVPGGQSNLSQRLNWLRAGVLGANDGIVSVAAVVVGVAGATTSTAPILTAGAAAVVGGAVSMALGEYVSVSSQSDSERELIAQETRELRDNPDGELEELAELYEAKGLSPDTAARVARELTARDALGAHLAIELGIDREDLVSPWHAAFASFLSFLVGALLPMIAILLPPPEARVPVTFVVTIAALALTGAIAAHIGGSSKWRAALRVVIGGALALTVTYAVGTLLGASAMG